MTVMLFTRRDHSANIRTLVHLPNVCLVTVMALPNDIVPTHTHKYLVCLSSIITPWERNDKFRLDT